VCLKHDDHLPSYIGPCTNLEDTKVMILYLNYEVRDQRTILMKYVELMKSKVNSKTVKLVLSECNSLMF